MGSGIFFREEIIHPAAHHDQRLMGGKSLEGHIQVMKILQRFGADAMVKLTLIIFIIPVGVLPGAADGAGRNRIC